LRRLAFFRARFAVGLLLLPTILVACADVSRRGRRIFGFGSSDWAWYGVALVESAALWASLLVLTSRRRGLFRWCAALAFVVLGAAALGSERYFFDQFETYLNRDAVLFGAAFPTSLEGQLVTDASELI